MWVHNEDTGEGTWDEDIAKRRRLDQIDRELRQAYSMRDQWQREISRLEKQRKAMK